MPTTMTTSELLGTPVLMYFTQPTDTFSDSYDSSADYTHYVLQDQTPTYNAASKGAFLCGPRSYSVSSNCAAFLTVDTSTADKPIVSLSSNSVTEQGTYSCSLDASLANHASVPVETSDTFTVTITDCEIVSFTKDTANPTTLIEYTLAGAAVPLTFPTYTQVPACQYDITYTCSIANHNLYPGWYPAGESAADADPQDAATSNVANFASDCTTSGATQVTYDITQYDSSANLDLTSYQYQGDYAVTITGRTVGAPVTYQDSGFYYILRVINPCIYRTFNTVPNYLTIPTALSDYATSVLNQDDASESQTVPMFTDWASSTYGNQDGYTLCGGVTYSVNPTTSWYFFTEDSATNEITGYIDSTLVSEINYVGNSDATQNTCWSMQVDAALTTYSAITTSDPFLACIEECEPTAFAMGTASTTHLNYNINDATATLTVPVWVQTPACGYSIVYTAEIEKTAADADSWVSEPIYAATPLTSTISGVTFDASTPAFSVYTTDRSFSGDYTLTVTAVLQETKYNAALNTNIETFTLTIADPCTTTLLNNVSPTSLNIAFQNMETSLFADPLVQSYTHLPLDTVGLQKGCADSGLANDASCFTEFCGTRTVTVTSYQWLTLDESAFTLTAQTNDPTDMNFQPNADNSAQGHQVDITICLDDYVSVCAASQTIWVKIAECTISSLTADSTMAGLSHTIFNVQSTMTISTYTQSPACGWDFIMMAEDVATGSQPSWLTYEQATNRWLVDSLSAGDEGTYTIRQTIQLQDTLDGNFIGTENSDLTFTITMVNPCKSGNYIIPLDGTGEIFDSANDVSSIYLLETSVIYGVDIDPNGIPITTQFTKHDDYVSSLYRSTSGIQYCCGARFYEIDVVAKDPNDGTRMGTFASIYDVSGDDTLEEIAIYTWDDLDVGIWQVQVTVSLFDYSFDGDDSDPLNIIPPSVSSIYEYAWTKIDMCIVKTFSEGAMSPSIEATLDSYADPLTPFTFEIYYYQQTSLTLSTYVLAPNCSYQIQYEFVVNQYPNGIAPNNFLSSFAFNANPIAGFISNEAGLDQATYGYVDPLTGATDYTTPSAINPYYVTYRAYIENYNPNSLEFENTDRELYIWPYDPCNGATLTPDSDINGGAVLIYFLGDGSFIPVQINFSQDSISLDPYYSPSSQYGNERCGGRQYSIVFEATDDVSSLASIAGEPLQNQEITVYTINAGNVGENTQRVKSCLEDYPHVCAYASFVVKVHVVVLPDPIEDQYYQIQAEDLTFQVGAYTIIPALDGYTIKYTVQVLWEGVVQYPTPTWITFNEQTMLFTVASNDYSVEGNWTVCLLGRPYDGQYEYGLYANLSYTQVMSLSPPPVEILIPPEFVTSLESQQFEAGTALFYQLPETFSSDGNIVTVQLQTSYPWLVYDEKTNSISVLSGSTSQEDEGNYVIQIELTDSVGSSQVYSLSITISEGVGLLVELEEELAKLALLPVPTLTDVSERGVLTISWNNKMKIPRNLTYVEESETTWFFEEVSEVRKVPALDIQVHSGGNTPQEDLAFVWHFISWTPDTILIQLIFDDPFQVSYAPEKDYVEIIFYQTAFFMDIYGAPVLGGPDGSVLDEELPPQIPHQDIVVPEDVISAGDVIGNLSQVIFQLVISYFLNNLWSMISTQQIIVMIPLFEISLPVVAGEFFKFLMEVAAFDIIPTDEAFAWMFSADPPDPLSENFGQVGFETTYFFFNLGSLTIALFSFPFQVIFSFLMKQMRSMKSLMRVGLKMERNLYWNNQIVIFNSSYVILIVCAMIQMTALEWDNGYGPFIFSFFAIFYGVACIIFPFFQLVLTWWNFKRLEDRPFQKRFGSMWEGMDTSHKGFLPFNFWFIVRRFQMGLLVVAWRGTLFFQISGLVFQTLIAMIIAGEGRPFKEKRANKMEFFNEIMILMILYNVMCLTDFQPNLEVQDYQGYIMIFCVLFHIFVNLALMLIDSIDLWRLKWARYRLLRKYAKTRAEKNRILQKKKRHDKWKRLMDEINQKKKEAERAEQNKITENYEMAQIENSIGSERVQVSEDEFDDQANVAQASLCNLPAEAPQVIQKRINEFADDSNATNQELNRKLGSKRKLDTSQNFVANVHKDIARAIPHDVMTDDPNTVMQDDMPEEWQTKDFYQHSRLEQNNFSAEELNANQKLNNRLGRMAQQDKMLNFKTKKVHPLKPSERVLRVMANAEAIHGKLFMQHEAGDGGGKDALDNKSRKKPIIPKAQQSFVVPKPRELVEQMEIEAQATELGVENTEQEVPGPNPQQDRLPEIHQIRNTAQIVDDFDFEFDVDANQGNL